MPSIASLLPIAAPPTVPPLPASRSDGAAAFATLIGLAGDAAAAPGKLLPESVTADPVEAQAAAPAVALPAPLSPTRAGRGLPATPSRTRPDDQTGSATDTDDLPADQGPREEGDAGPKTPLEVSAVVVPAAPRLALAPSPAPLLSSPAPLERSDLDRITAAEPTVHRVAAPVAARHDASTSAQSRAEIPEPAPGLVVASPSPGTASAKLGGASTARTGPPVSAAPAAPTGREMDRISDPLTPDLLVKPEHAPTPRLATLRSDAAVAPDQPRRLSHAGLGSHRQRFDPVAVRSDTAVPFRFRIAASPGQPAVATPKQLAQIGAKRPAAQVGPRAGAIAHPAPRPHTSSRSATNVDRSAPRLDEPAPLNVGARPSASARSPDRPLAAAHPRPAPLAPTESAPAAADQAADSDQNAPARGPRPDAANITRPEPRRSRLPAAEPAQTGPSPRPERKPAGAEPVRAPLGDPAHVPAPAPSRGEVPAPAKTIRPEPGPGRSAAVETPHITASRRAETRPPPSEPGTTPVGDETDQIPHASSPLRTEPKPEQRTDQRREVADPAAPASAVLRQPTSTIAQTAPAIRATTFPSAIPELPVPAALLPSVPTLGRSALPRTELRPTVGAQQPDSVRDQRGADVSPGTPDDLRAPSPATAPHSTAPAVTAMALPVPISPEPARTTPKPAPIRGDTPADPRPIQQPAPTPVAGTATTRPLPDTATLLVQRASNQPRAAVSDAAPIAAPVPAAAIPGAPLSNAPDSTPLDMSRQSWPTAMIDRIERLRDAADAVSTSIRVIPDALGAIDVSIRHEGQVTHVHLAAEQPQTRALLAEASPKLAELADQRGLRLGQTEVAANFGSGPGANGGQPSAHQQGSAPRRSIEPRADASPDAPDDHRSDDLRIA